jgi:hypothetical protein
MTFGGVDTYYDYDERQWKLRRLGGGPVRRGRVCPVAKSSSDESAKEDSKGLEGLEGRGEFLREEVEESDGVRACVDQG